MTENKEKARREVVREFRELEAAPPPVVRGEPGQFGADRRKSRAILVRMRAYRDRVVREREGRPS